MTPEQFQSDLAAAALLMSRSTPGVPLDAIRDAMTIGADLALKYAADVVKLEREQLALQRDKSNLPN